MKFIKIYAKIYIDLIANDFEYWHLVCKCIEVFGIQK